MKLLGMAAVLMGSVAISAPAFAALSEGVTAPQFEAPASLGGKEFSFSLAAALHDGPVVLYFYPAAFTKGCTVEAHDFADASDAFKAAHATVIGVSMDKIETLDKFSVSECRSRFAVAADPTGSIATRYDAKMPLLHFATRTSYVIAPDGHIVLAYSNKSPDEHVSRTLAAVQAYASAKH
ncbi:thioredoxin peroxidase [Ameyamaea chiangmaiensis NBRC 103196]|uniref:thioredoxin-dependent peroxiredoxin n=1 Tax=Ameyamaea chiangmaiensis TaxID=442969 RepID=A0A850PC61_9PROT|nr:peroxiredoxin [Ameyamaea chiangmaiensis]MBS4076022.1 peroxiredoxin [Ameyamaea chiangmaiensis]NVN40110.1 peroxiredoxin [Ameyamaea chiangmaiensis]GBQ61431.1 thioredoxin peroxidase [Ameyamaea chiangmaiensis NBRC 103196]